MLKNQKRSNIKPGKCFIECRKKKSKINLFDSDIDNIYHISCLSNIKLSSIELISRYKILEVLSSVDYTFQYTETMLEASYSCLVEDLDKGHKFKKSVFCQLGPYSQYHTPDRKENEEYLQKDLNETEQETNLSGMVGNLYTDRFVKFNGKEIY